MEPVVLALVALVGLCRRHRPSASPHAASGPTSRSRPPTEKAARIVSDARAQQKDLILEAKEEKFASSAKRRTTPGSAAASSPNMERRLHARDEQLDQRADMLEQRDRKLLEKQIELDKGREELEKLNQERVLALEQVSGMSAEDAKGVLLEAIREEAEHDAVKLARSIERRAREEAARRLATSS